MNKRNAFTLFEMLVVSCIFSILLWCIPLPRTEKFVEAIHQQQLTQQLSHFLINAQTTAMTYQQAVTVRFEPSTQSIRYFTADRVIVEALNLNDNWIINHYDSFHYFADGRIDRYNTVYLWYEPSHTRYAITFQLGSGRFEIMPR